MTSELLTEEQVLTKEAAEPLTPHWVDQEAQAEKAARSHEAGAVWIVQRPMLAKRMVRGILWPSRRAGFLILLGSPPPAMLPALEQRFRRVVYADKAGGFLPREELKAVLKSADRRDRFVGGMVDEETKIATLWRGDLTSLVVPLAAFAPTASGVRPDWKRFAVTDYGHTLRFGPYEAAADAVLYEFDLDFRRRVNKTRIATERTLGASIRRLRMQRQKTRQDFPGLDPKTLARIERGEVEKPHAETLRLIADRLGVKVEELASF